MALRVLSYLIIAVFGASCAGDPAPAPSDAGADVDAAAGCTSCGACSEELPVKSFLHSVDPIEYADVPPASGDHDPCWARWGVHEQVVPARNWLHNLEHGGVVFLYDCPDGCDADRDNLRALVQAKPRTLLTEYPGLPARFAAVAWGHRLVSDCADIPTFQAFYGIHFDHGRESIGSEPPASCLVTPSN